MNTLMKVTIVCAVGTAAIFVVLGGLDIDLGEPLFTIAVLPLTLLASAHFANFLQRCWKREGRRAVLELGVVVVAMSIAHVGVIEYSKQPGGVRDPNPATRGFELPGATHE
jgi:cytochrome c biogenesis factor